jgi:hypothetical protein
MWDEFESGPCTSKEAYPFDISVRDVAMVEISDSFDHTQKLGSEKASSEATVSAGRVF